MATAFELVSRFVRGVLGADLTKTFVNPLDIRIGDKININADGFRAHDLVLEKISETDMTIEVGNDEIDSRFIDYGFLMGEGEPTRVRLRIVPFSTALEGKGYLLTVVDRHGYRMELDDRLDEPNHIFEYGGKKYQRIGVDTNGEECDRYEVTDRDQDQKAELNEANWTSVKSWRFSNPENPNDVLFVEYSKYYDVVEVLQGEAIELDLIGIVE